MYLVVCNKDVEKIIKIIKKEKTFLDDDAKSNVTCIYNSSIFTRLQRQGLCFSFIYICMWYSLYARIFQTVGC